MTMRARPAILAPSYDDGDDLPAELLDALGEMAQLGDGIRAKLGNLGVTRAMHSPDWIRWGDQSSVRAVGGSAGPAVGIQTGQLLRLDLDRPTTISLLLTADFVGFAGDTVLPVVTFKVMVGVGSANVTLVRTATADAAYDQASFLLQVPAKNVQVQATASLPSGSYTGNESILFTALGAPLVV